MTEASATWHDLCIHGHAHAGSECGTTPGGAPVRNVALPVLKRAYAVYCLGKPGSLCADPGQAGQAGTSPVVRRS
jgi:hypothetical protein